MTGYCSNRFEEEEENRNESGYESSQDDLLLDQLHATSLVCGGSINPVTSQNSAPLEFSSTKRNWWSGSSDSLDHSSDHISDAATWGDPPASSSPWTQDWNPTPTTTPTGSFSSSKSTWLAPLDKSDSHSLKSKASFSSSCASSYSSRSLRSSALFTSLDSTRDNYVHRRRAISVKTPKPQRPSYGCLPHLIHVLESVKEFPTLYSVAAQFIILLMTQQQVKMQLDETPPWNLNLLNIKELTNITTLAVIKWIFSITNRDHRTTEQDQAVFTAAAITGLDAVIHYLQTVQNISVSGMREEAIIAAACHGHLSTVKLLHSLGANPRARWDAAFRKSAAGGSFPCMKYLISQGADPHALDDSALVLAAQYGHTSVVVHLVSQYGADPRAGDDAALVGSASNGHIALVKYLHRQGADICSQDHLALRRAAANGHAETCRYLLRHGADLYARDHEATLNAAAGGHLDLLKEFISLGGNVFIDSCVSLRHAAVGGHTDVVHYIADLHYSTFGRAPPGLDSALKDAARGGHLVIAKYLVALGADVRVDTDAALKCACVSGNLELVKWLISQGCDVHSGADLCVRRASKHGWVNVVQWLVDVAGADCRVKDDKCVRNAAGQGHLNVVMWLYHNAKVDIRAVDDLAITLASKGGHLAVVEWLAMHGADPAAGGMRALWGAVACKQLGVVQWLRNACGLTEDQDEQRDSDQTMTWNLAVGGGVGWDDVGANGGTIRRTR
ncbi:ankyrin repeat-containing domain protein [Cladochytrium replicatum]|nr:ankyrin repeat-containing domain protein [Cladochytrium replicatum]